jgi:putative hydrolase
MSGHAFSTVEEMAAACLRAKLEGFTLTDHGPAMPGSASHVYFISLHMLPRELDGVRILRGVEANIMDYNGKLDLTNTTLRKLDVVIASFHEILLRPTSTADHTRAYLALAENPLVDIIGHPGRGPYPFDFETVMAACKKHNKLFEINNHTLASNNLNDQCLRIAAACKAAGVKVVVNSDAHLSRNIGKVDSALKLLASVEFPEELIMNTTYEKFRTDLLLRKPWLDL